mgnify:CR=1 FL=1
MRGEDEETVVKYQRGFEAMRELFLSIEEAHGMITANNHDHGLHGRGLFYELRHYCHCCVFREILI